jgi:predicted RNase H-like HicB family nuclease
MLHCAGDGISIVFPDLPGCCPCASTPEEAAKNAREALGLHLYGMECDGDEIPVPTALSELPKNKKSIALLVEVFMPPIRERIRTRYVKKTLSIPAWLNYEAEKNGVNFSQVLQNGLKEYMSL